MAHEPNAIGEICLCSRPNPARQLSPRPNNDEFAAFPARGECPPSVEQHLKALSIVTKRTDENESSQVRPKSKRSGQLSSKSGFDWEEPLPVDAAVDGSD